MKQTFLVLLWCFLVSGTIPNAENKAAYEAFAKQKKFDCVGQVLINGKSEGSCVLIADAWVITAAHVLEDEEISTVKVVLLGKTYSIEKHVVHPKYQGKDIDLALLKLVESTENCVPAKLFSAANELGKTGEIVGWGVYGTAFKPSIDTNFTKLGGTNCIEQVGGKVENRKLKVDKHTLLTDFESAEIPRSNSIGSMQPTNLEIGINGGDSGGGLFIEENGEIYLAGIIKTTYFVFKMKIDPDKQHFTIDEEDFKEIGLFGSIDAFTRVSTNLKWIKLVTGI